MHMNFSIGLRYMLLSAVGFSLMAVCVKLAFEDGIPVLQIVAARALVSLLLSYFFAKRKGLSVLGSHRGLLFARGFVGAVALLAVYSALTRLPLAEATMLQYLHPVFVAVLALFFLAERFHASLLGSIVLSLVGLILVVEPSWVHGGSLTQLDQLGVIFALIGAFGSAIAYVLVRKLSHLEDSSVIIFYFPLIALPFSLVVLGNDFVVPESWTTYFVLLAVGIFTQIGQEGLTKAMKTETAARATAFSYVQVVFSVIFGWMFFAEVPSILAVVGVVLIMLGALLNVMHKTKVS
ncbi:hypothetical protein A3762_13200 [Oleiphilus sp. HI0125]|uniref:DMT family transporter n=1 Tax=Oleiphilus sp. HI0125 TaxID=1822266 RepID=UPI0007C2A9DB|nr:DMT family transporter [Oleiphilus sp. HI0125]KZZ58241.1 hypothetical protein A3762_18600 [Oleiphilus sp. HI0125]KZZ62642.1 hypothetical protein A3762_13200 [Oleiphilus sp. HI0125]